MGTTIRRRPKSQRVKSEIYQLNLIASVPDEGENQSEPPFRLKDDVHFIEGGIEGIQFVSIPETVSLAMAQELKADLEAQQAEAKVKNPKRIITVCHNTQFVRVRKLSPKEASKVIRKLEDDEIARRKALGEAVEVVGDPVQSSGLVGPDGQPLS